MSVSKRRIQQSLLVLAMLALAALFSYLLCLTCLPIKTKTVHSRFIKTQKNKARDGIFQLEGFGQKIIPLAGEWEFYWQEFLFKNDFAIQAKKPDVAKVPGVWSDLKKEGRQLPGFGYGTYRLRLHGLNKGQELALYLPVLAVSYELYADDTLIASNGKISKSEEGFQPEFLPRIAYFTAQGKAVDLIVHVSNYVYARNGMWHPIYLGTFIEIEQMNRMILYKDLFMIGAFLTLAIYYLSLFALRKESQNFLFVLLCLGAIMRTMVNGDRTIVRIFADFPFALLIKFDYMSLLLFYPILLFLMTRRYPKEFVFPVTVAFIGFGVITSLLVLFLPVQIFTQYVLIAEIFLFATIICTLASLFLAVLRFRKNAFPMFVSVLLLLFLTLRDLLHQSAIADNPLGEVSAFGFFVFLLLESYAISRDYADSFSSVKRLSQQLLESDKLKDKIRQTEMAFLQSQIKPHFLYNSLSVIDEYCQINPKEASRLINSLAKYLRQSFDFENLESTVSIEKELALVRYYVDIERARFDDLTVECQIDFENDFFLPPLTIQPLVENAIRHGARKKAGEGIVAIRIRQADADITISVSDNGAGIPKEKLDILLNLPDKHKSVGLLNIHNRLMHMYGRGLLITSEVNKGTQVSFTIPGGGA